MIAYAVRPWKSWNTDHEEDGIGYEVEHYRGNQDDGFYEYDNIVSATVLNREEFLEVWFDEEAVLESEEDLIDFLQKKDYAER